MTKAINETILLVEDEEDLRNQYSEILRMEGYTVDTAATGEEGYTKIRTGDYDLVLLDIILPGLDGLSIMRKIREEGTPASNKTIIFLTNLDKDEEIKQALELGNGYLIKSQITPPDLLREVRLYLDRMADPSAVQ